MPQGCFPALGEDQWLTISVRNDDEWQALCKAMRRPDLAADPQLKTAHGRRRHEDMIEAEIAKWTNIVRPDSAMVKLQAAGVPAGIAKVPMDLAHDPHLLAIGHWQSVDKVFVGPHLLPLNAYREGDADKPAPVRSLAPTLGRDNHEVLREVLGLSDAELKALEEQARSSARWPCRRDRRRRRPHRMPRNSLLAPPSCPRKRASSTPSAVI